MAQGTKEDPFIGQYRIDAVRDAGQLQLGPNTFNKYLLDLTNAAGQQKQDLEMLRKPQSPAPQAGPSPVMMQVFQDKGYWKCKYAPSNQGGPPAQGGGGGGQGGAGVVGSDEERNRSIIMQVSVKVAGDVLKGTTDAHADGILAFADALAEGILAFAKKGGPAPAPAPQPQAQPQPAPTPQASPQGGGWGPQGGGQQGGFPATSNDDIPF